jgi:hypothetical protein
MHQPVILRILTEKKKQTCGIFESLQVYEMLFTKYKIVSSLFLRMLLPTPWKSRDTTLLDPTYSEG